MQLPRRIQLRASSRLAALLMLIHGAAFFSLLLPPLPPVLKLLGGAAVLASCRRCVRRDPEAVIALELRAGGMLGIVRRDGLHEEAGVLPASTLFPGLIVILLQPAQGGRRLKPVVLLADSLAADDMRILRVWLRWKAAPLATRHSVSPGDQV